MNIKFHKIREEDSASMKVLTGEKLLRMIISLVAILSSILAPVSLTHGTAAKDRVWVQTQNRIGSSLGLLNLSSGEITPVFGLALPERVGLISESFDGQYVAIATSIRTKTSVSQIIIVAKIHQEARQIRLEPYTTLPGYSRAIWAPDTLELLLARTNWSRVSVWDVQARAADETRPAVIDIDDVCDATWGSTSNTILISVCAGERRLVSYLRSRQQEDVLLRYNLRIQNDYAHFATLENQNKNHRKILLFTDTDRDPVQKNAYEMRVILTGRWMIFDTIEGRYQVVPRLFSSGAPRFGTFVSSDRLLIIGQAPISGTSLGWDYIQYSITQQKVTPLMLADRSCPRAIVPSKQNETYLLIEYIPCDEGLAAGIYRFDVNTGQRERITIKGSDLWQLIPILLP